jgi:Na+/H+ antiporter 1
MVVTTRTSEEVALTEPATPTGRFCGRTPWSRSLQAPLRAFLQTESGSAGVFLLATPVVIFLALNAGRASAAGWGATMSTDTAFAPGLLALVARGLPDRVRIFLLTVVVVDDLVALLVIATVYSGPVAPGPLLLALGILGGILLLRMARIRYGLLYFLFDPAGTPRGPHSASREAPSAMSRQSRTCARSHASPIVTSRSGPNHPGEPGQGVTSPKTIRPRMS